MTGNEAPAGTIGIRPRLFKSGILCEAIDYQYNAWPATEHSFATSNTCGDGWYNSHGFVAVWNDATGAYAQYPTFPTRSIWVTGLEEPSVATARASVFGLDDGHEGEIAPEARDAPEGFTAAFGDSGVVGYVSDLDLDQGPVGSPSQINQSTPSTRSIPVYDKETMQVVDSFTLRG